MTEREYTASKIGVDAAGAHYRLGDDAPYDQLTLDGEADTVRFGQSGPRIVYIVVEDNAGSRLSVIRAAFETEAAAEAYVQDPDNLGPLTVVPAPVEVSYDDGDSAEDSDA